MPPNFLNTPTCPWNYKTPVGMPLKPGISKDKKKEFTSLFNFPKISSNILKSACKMGQLDSEKLAQRLQDRANKVPLKKCFLKLEIVETNPVAVTKNGTKYYKVGQMLINDFNQISYHPNENFTNAGININEYSYNNHENVGICINNGTLTYSEQISDSFIAKPGTKIDMYHKLIENNGNSDKRIVSHPQLNKSVTKNITYSNMAAQRRHNVTDKKSQAVVKTTILTKGTIENNETPYDAPKCRDKNSYKRVISYVCTPNECITEFLGFPKTTVAKGINQDNLDRSPSYSISYAPHTKAKLQKMAKEKQMSGLY